ncbi:HNH endonuclease signature motif containing protein [Streptomyces sp. NPDC046161]|uniref:HNH endonuclease n=1 Tax=Streptomyces sp. NPDC046161 TaxID=3155132 RepID=UPI0033C0AAC6
MRPSREPNPFARTKPDTATASPRTAALDPRGQEAPMSRHRGFRIPWRRQMLTCVICHGPLVGKQRVVCSPACRSKRIVASEAWREAKARSEAKPETKANKRSAWQAGKEIRTCAWCGKQWPTHPRHRAKYCSPRCAKTPQGPYPSCQVPPGHPSLPPPQLALPPGKPQGRLRETRVEAPKSRGVRLVSARCRHCHQSYVLIGEYESSYCSRRCSRAYRKARRRAQKLQVRCEVISRATVFERDDWRCHLCGFNVLRAAVDAYHPASPTLDHVVPLSLGGDHTMDNLRTAHASCNSTKGNRTYLTQISPPKEAPGEGIGVAITSPNPRGPAAVSWDGARSDRPWGDQAPDLP